MVSALIAWVIAIFAPFIWAFANILDKYAISSKIKHPLSFASVIGLVLILYGIVISLFLDWSGIGLMVILVPVIAGLIYGLQYFFYYLILQKEDASHTVGLLYTYPLIVALLSFLFLNEVIPVLGYIGVLLVIAGALVISLRIKKIGLKSSIWLFLMLIIPVAVAEFLMKVSTNSLSPIHGVAINLTSMGAILLIVLLSRNVRSNFRYDIKNFKWALLNGTFYSIGILTIYLAMSGMSATIFTAIAAIQPLGVLIYEKLFFTNSKMVRDKVLKHKLIGIILVILGIAFLSFSQLSN